jgi:hypothetical protein
MAEEQAAPARRRRGRPKGSGTASRGTGARSTGTRRRRLQGPELVESLNQMVNDLIKENRRLKRLLDKLVVKGGPSDAGSVERSLRSLQRRVQRAVTPAPMSRRRRSATPATAPRRRRRTGEG